MGVPVILLGESLVDAVVEVLVVGENNVAADIVKLRGKRALAVHGVARIDCILTKPSSVTSVLARPPAFSLASTMSHEGPFCERC